MMMPAISEKVYIAQGVDFLPDGHDFRLFKPENVEYQPFCDDFGAMNLSSIVHFIEQLQGEMTAHPDSKIIYSVISDGTRSLTNAVFLLGAYMIIVQQRKVQPRQRSASTGLTRSM
jgi:hypothetical protein